MTKTKSASRLFGDAQSIEELLGLFAGFASLCWDPKPTDQVFDTTRAQNGVTDALLRLGELLPDTAAPRPPAVEELEAELERTRVQLAGCGVAALGTDLDLSPDAYGWSGSFGNVVQLYRSYEAARDLAEERQHMIDVLTNPALGEVVVVEGTVAETVDARFTVCSHCFTALT